MERILFYSPAGPLGLEAEGEGLTALYLPSQCAGLTAGRSSPLLEEAKAQVLAYFRGERRVFSLPLTPRGTPFRQSVWKCLRDIPYGTVISYKELARRVGRPKGFQAVGQANRFNPLPILIPCHRVVAADGSLGGYAGGLELKEFLLNLEDARNGKK